MLCECGCGNETEIAKGNRTARGWVAGQPKRFVLGHGHGMRHCARIKSRYIKVSAAEHPNANSQGKVYEHVLVASLVLDGWVPPGVQIHHRDGDGHNNTNSNLIICENRGYHALIEMRERAYRETGDAHSRRCDRCHEWDNPENLHLGRAGNCYHRECAKASTLRSYHARMEKKRAAHT